MGLGACCYYMFYSSCAQVAVTRGQVYMMSDSVGSFVK